MQKLFFSRKYHWRSSGQIVDAALPLFVGFSVLGWICEVVFEYIFNRTIINRGFLTGPYLPIYGFGAIVLFVVLWKVECVAGKGGGRKLAAMFLAASLAATLIEFYVSCVMELLFARRWWDYSCYRFNINGRVCLMTSLLFGVGGVLSWLVILPSFLRVMKKTHTGRRRLLFCTLFGIITIDFCLTICNI